MKDLTKISRLTLIIVLLFVTLHFLKDITQDVLKIPTFLDLLGNVNEDISGFPRYIQLIFTGIGYTSFLVEIFLIISITFLLKGARNTNLEKSVWIAITSLIWYFVIVSLLDPRFSFWR